MLLQFVQFALSAVLQENRPRKLQTAKTASCKWDDLLQFLIFSMFDFSDYIRLVKFGKCIHD